jgi:2-polyprenyl-3-methyl-5-hydroxy-6-metoxy-1,4-benzoquinol methylase
MKLYDQWAATYNSEVNGKEYVAPLLAAKEALKIPGAASGTILDAGCGTGLVAEALAAGGAKTIDGMDLSEPMLKLAEQTGVFRSVFKADMSKKLSLNDNIYDVITCVGTFTSGHVGPDPGLRELVRIAKKGGTVISTILEDIWIPGGFKAEVEKLEQSGAAKVVSMESLDYVKGRGDKARFLILEKA